MLEYMFKSVLLLSAAGSIFGLVIYLIKPLTKKFFSPVWHYYIWLIVLLVFVIPVKFTIPQRSTPQDSAESLKNEVTFRLSEDLPSQDENLVIREDLAFAPAQNAEWQNAKAKALLHGSILTYVSYIWLIGCILFLITRICRYIKFIVILRKNSVIGEKQADIPKKLDVRVTDVLDAPLLVGIFKPTLYLTELNDANSDFVLMHELMHYKRKDILYKWFAFFVLCAHWFNPFAHFASNTIDEECEISCDYTVTRALNSDDKKGYMNTILLMLEKALSTRPLTTQMASTKKIIKKRFAAIKENTDKSRKRIFLSLIISAFLLLTALFASGILQGRIKTEDKNDILKIQTDVRTGESANLLVCGIDNSGRVDCIMLFSTDGKTINVLSIPRNAAFNLDGEIKTASQLALEADGDQKIVNAVRENFMLPVNYYAKVNMTAAEKIIDALGGINYNIPMDMSYSDPYQGLEIDLKKGAQHLTGNEAMQFLRYRKGYAEGELKRGEMHLDFINSFIVQKVNMENLKKLPEIIEILSENIQTNYPLKSAKRDLKLIADTEEENLTFYLLPGEISVIENNTLIFQIDYTKSKNVFELIRHGPVFNAYDNAEKLSANDIKKLQADVDNGHYPWRLNPEETAMEYMKNEGFSEGVITALAGSGNKCSVTFSSNGLSHIIDLYKPAKQTNEGIWVVKTAETLIEDFVFTTEEVESAKEVVYEYYKQLAKRNREGILKTMTPWHDMPNAVFWQDEKIVLKNLHYSVNDPMRLSYIKTGRGSVNGTEYQNVIVLKADIDVTYNEGEKSVWSQGEYGWNLILIRDGKNGNWLIDDMGW